jgi:hypothetical protein
VPLNIFNQFGGALGGRIVKDKLFFFGDWESTRQTQAPAAGNPQTVPLDRVRTGDFRGLVDAKGNPITIYDPNTGDPNGANRTPISCNGVQNMICPNRIDPAEAAMIALIPEPNQPGVANNYLSGQKGSFSRDDVDGKINHVPSQRSTVFGRYSFSRSDIFDPPVLGAAGGNATLGGQPGNSFSRIQVVGLGGTYTFSPNLLLDANGGFTRQRINAENTDIAKDKAFGLQTLKIPGTNDPANQLYWGQPAFQFGSAGGLYANLGNASTGNPFVFRDNQYVGNANLTWIRGRHQLRSGIEYNHVQLNHSSRKAEPSRPPAEVSGFPERPLSKLHAQAGSVLRRMRHRHCNTTRLQIFCLVCLPNLARRCRMSILSRCGGRNGDGMRETSTR